MAYNESGYTLSNCISVTIDVPPPTEPPGSFSLSSNAGSPDNDGNFALSWTTSEGATSYSVYVCGNYISEINGTVTLLADRSAVSPYSITGLSNGDYHYVAVAHNDYGETMSNCIKITVQLPSPPDTPGIPGYDIFFLLLLSGIGLAACIIIHKKVRKI